jgi:SAM-dependent methyltransferase
MIDPFHTLNEQNAGTAFSRQSFVFDELYSHNAIVQYKRARVREHVEYFLKPTSSILELNSGTGEDAVYFARKGHYVHATDLSEGMQEMLRQKVQTASLEQFVSQECCSFTKLEDLKCKGPYDLVFSNFAGLNCSGELHKTLCALSSLTKSGGIVTLVILPGFCLWETLLLFKGKFRTAFRRSFSKSGVKARVEGEYFRCWYYDPAYVLKNLSNDFELLRLEGLCNFVPPSYMEQFAEKHPGLFSFLKRMEKKYSTRWPWRNIGDYYIITLRKKTVQ